MGEGSQFCKGDFRSDQRVKGKINNDVKEISF